MSIIRSARPQGKSTASTPAFPSGPPVAPVRQQFNRRPFGSGILAGMPSYRLDCTIQDLAWYEEQLALEECRELDRRFREFEAMDRMSRGLDPW